MLRRFSRTGRLRPMRVMISSENDDLALRALQCLDLAGVKAYVACSEAGTSLCRLSRACLGMVELPKQMKRAQGVRFYKAQARSLGITHLIPADISQTLLLSAIDRHIPPIAVFPVPQINTAATLNDKFRFARLLQELKLPGPRIALLQTPADVENHGLGPSVMVKPLRSEGGRGVHHCSTHEELRGIVAGMNSFPDQPLLLQEYIPGEDIDLSVLAEHGSIVAWTVHQRPAGEAGRENGSLIFVEDEEVLRLGRSLLAATGYHGVANIDMRRDSRDGRIKFIEFNPRVYASVHFAAYAGVNFIAAGLKLATGAALPVIARAAGIVHAPPALLRLVFRNESKLRCFTWSTLRALGQAILDPLPWLGSAIQRRRLRLPVIVGETPRLARSGTGRG